MVALVVPAPVMLLSMIGWTPVAEAVYERIMLPLPSTEVAKAPDVTSLVPAIAAKFALPELVAEPLRETTFQVWLDCQKELVELGNAARNSSDRMELPARLRVPPVTESWSKSTPGVPVLASLFAVSFQIFVAALRSPPFNNVNFPALVMPPPPIEPPPLMVTGPAMVPLPPSRASAKTLT